MKKVKAIIYGVCNIWLLMICSLYTIALAYNGFEEVSNYSLDGGLLAMTIISAWVVILRYPVKQWANGVIKVIKNDFEDRRKERQKQNRAKAA